jgi:DNA-directed RNA polymerase specialized sigma24 family protein
MIRLNTLAPRWTLTEETFGQFITTLHPDPEQAGLAYEDLRQRLTFFFEMRRCPMPETLTDETINRLIRKISEGVDVLSLDSYVFAIAKYVYLESRHGKPMASLEDCLPADELKVAERTETLRREMEKDLFHSNCMKKCLLKLPTETQALLIEYYQGEGREQTAYRHKMAQARGINTNTLYIQVHRIREKLEGCLANCLKKA